MTPSRKARIRAGLDLAEAAERVRITPKDLTQCERANSFPWALAQRLSRIYGCSSADFLRRLEPRRNRSSGTPRGASVGGAPQLRADLVRRAIEFGARSGGEVVALVRRYAVAMAADTGDENRRRQGREQLRALKHRRRAAIEEAREALTTWRRATP